MIAIVEQVNRDIYRLLKVITKPYIILLILAGDYVKFGFPAAAAMTVLAWGGISYKEGYKSACEYDNLLKAIKWGTDFFIKCHVSDNEFYGQVTE